MKTGRPRRIHIDAIRTDGDTQVRAAIDDQTVADYAAAIDRGEKLPPIVAFHDGAAYWLADGFHRLFAYRRHGDTILDVQVLQGTKRDAAWHALGANRTNGLRMTNADKAKAIQIALRLKPDQSDRSIAEHIGCDHKTVARGRAELSATGEIPQSETRQSLDGRRRPATQPRLAVVQPPREDDLPTDCPSREDDLPPDCPSEEDNPPTTDPQQTAGTDAGRATDGAPGDDAQPSGDAPIRTDEPPPATSTPTDRLGNPITDARIAEAFSRDHELVELSTVAGRLKKAVLDAVDEHDPLFADIVRGQFQADITNVRRQIENARPYAICPYCGGERCRACGQRGYVNQINYSAAPPNTGAQQQP